MADHEHGTMDITVQEQTYTGFITFVTRFCMALVVFVIFLAIFAI
ncbi:aa3-type cytochrome c oxidase subunit IV [Epibacterium sp. SM1979]|uniref:Aa3-type cytochrome c oxidase subunit IV n=1 Tax=Tritonibacter litoralis TaxID=2662264 RepID=A0A843YCL6_9RHOB|nr:aa3-type cytochrome c oxidase subunit IV [Tritonibacter litoralis]MQQ08746.1 aa3-type cytochrome c oxidase subunit IV [Tritonibacter litoralis]